MKMKAVRFLRLLGADVAEGFTSIARLVLVSGALFALLIGLLFLKMGASGIDFSGASFACLLYTSDAADD